MKEIQTDVGVIIGRFQLHKLHSEHIKLIETVLQNHTKTIIFLGTTVVIGSKENPLDFLTRKLMLEEKFGTKISAILPLPDKKLNSVWSNNLDSKVREVFPSESITLYGSKDSFIPYYTGSFKTCELAPEIYISATDIRESISKQVLSSEEFRAGAIYATFSLYPTVYSTIDILIKNSKKELLIGRKAEETKWRFIGGFVDPGDTTDISACKREGMEETGLELDNFKFICSQKISDWRYKRTKDRSIMTRFYECDYIFGTPQPMDDIAELKWVKPTKELGNTLVGGHTELYNTWYNLYINRQVII